MIGGAFDYDHTIGDFDANYGDFDTDTFTWIFFGSYSPSDQSFIDASVGFGAKQYDTRHDDPGPAPTTPSKVTPADLNSAPISPAATTSASGLHRRPRAGLHYKRSELNGFTETGTGALFTYSDQVDDLLTGTVGFQASYAISTDFGVVVPQVNGEYVREFLTDHNTYTAASVAAGAPFNFVTDDPDLNHFNVGAGVVFVLPDGISPFLNFQAELANRLEETQTVTAGVRVEM
mgnify:CR=1 FL=1